ncbi:hypothetical protein BT93_L0684 [Corymbia citriodora subsp. variegata]|uniref:Uncharacterized protein n=1 Tax=Corymbia citriodora subsp. variegata TaxID=360336 RepID=A0A8T0CEH1_CORYI|nr:hypothetical protein BT93_L0684 [Corymbia citriodora subsp. variegata]
MISKAAPRALVVRYVRLCTYHVFLFTVNNSSSFQFLGKWIFAPAYLLTQLQYGLCCLPPSLTFLHSLAEGATVWFCSRTEGDVRARHIEWSKAYPSAKNYGMTTDVSSPESVSEFVSNAVAASGQIDIIIPNVSALLMDDTVEAWTTLFNTDMLSTITLVNAALPHLEKSHGNIVAIGSVSGRMIDMSAPGPYGAFKAALNHYMAQLARTLAPKGIRANTVSPGTTYVEDGFWGNVEKGKPEMFKQVVAANPMGRMGTPEEIANAVVFLASERASFISGTNLIVDGALGAGVQF